MRNFFIVVFLGLFTTIQSQENYRVNDIGPALLLNANAVVREHKILIEINEVDEVEITKRRVVTVLNKAGDSFVLAYENFDENLSILDQRAVILDYNSEEIQKFKKKDFTEQSHFQDFVLFSDNRISFMEYTPRKYPYTVVYTSKVRSGNSVFLPDWWPSYGYKVSVEKSSYRLLNEVQVPIRFVERNLEGLDYTVNNTEFELEYTATGIKAKLYEPLSPPLRETAAQVLVALKRFSLEGIEGESDNWEDFGKWQYDHLIAGQGFLTDVIVREISELTKEAKTIEEKARLIYKYVQDNTRYIAVQLGIGGWKPYSASEVDRLGYGDCKGLTNYTKALLASQGIESDYTVIFGGPRRDIDPEFMKIQGNHAVLSIPTEGGEDIWLECTSQDAPFNYLGDFIDDRFAIKIKPTGGEIVRTRKYNAEDNLQKTNADISLNTEGGFNAVFERSSHGVPYGDIYLLELESDDIKKTYYRENWSHFQNIYFESIEFTNDKTEIDFTENLNFSADRFCSNAGERLLVPLNFVNGFKTKIAKDTKREKPIRVKRGKSFEDHFNYYLPAGYFVEALPRGTTIDTEFGSISIETRITEQDGMQKIQVIRNLRLNDGEWAPEKFEDFRKFINQVHHLSNQKAVIAPLNKV